MMNYLQQETLALMQHEERLAEAAKRRLTHTPRTHALPLMAWFQWFGEQRRKWFAPQPPVIVDQAC